MKNEKFDVFVIGSGIAGQTVAKACTRAGLQVAVADNREFGGTCATRGCDPKKVLLGATGVLERAHTMKGRGIAKEPRIIWKKLQKFKRRFTDSIPADTERNLRELGISLFHQSPKFLSGNRLSVEGKFIDASKIVIATGRSPRPLSVLGRDFLKNSDDFLRLDHIPKSLVFIGAGYVGMEFAHMAARALRNRPDKKRTRITVIDTGSRPLKHFDPDLVSELTQFSKGMGIDFVFEADVKRIEKLRKNYRVSYIQQGKGHQVKGRLVFNTAGRIPSVDSLDLDKGNIAMGKDGIQVNKYLQSTSNPGVYACGDVSEHALPLTPLSGREGSLVAENIIHGNRKEVDAPSIPSAVFTLPHLAMVGLSEEAARKRYKQVKVNHASVPEWYNAKRINAPIYAYKTLVNSRTGRLVGAHLLGPEAAETINLFAMAIHTGMTTDALKDLIFTYPSWCSDIQSMV